MTVQSQGLPGGHRRVTRRGTRGWSHSGGRPRGGGCEGSEGTHARAVSRGWGAGAQSEGAAECGASVGPSAAQRKGPAGWPGRRPKVPSRPRATPEQTGGWGSEGPAGEQKREEGPRLARRLSLDLGSVEAWEDDTGLDSGLDLIRCSARVQGRLHHPASWQRGLWVLTRRPIRSEDWLGGRRLGSPQGSASQRPRPRRQG